MNHEDTKVTKRTKATSILHPLYRLMRSILPLALLLGLTVPALASHLIIDLTVEGNPSAAHAGTDTMPPANGKSARPVVHMRVGDPVRLRWRVKNSQPHKKLEKLLVHLFVVPEAQAGQKDVP